MPNALTLIRLVLIIPFLFYLYTHEYALAFYIFLIAGFTDGLDGWLARHYNWKSSFGSVMDPLADKLLVATSYISLALLGKLPWWLVTLVFFRDLTISLGVISWYIFIRKRIDFMPTMLSKLNTTFQLALVILCLYELTFSTSIPYLFSILIYLVAITTAATFLNYVWTWGKKAYKTQHPIHE
jgi:cardiolipin synthase